MRPSVPCPWCGQERASNGLCPKCDHLMCKTCYQVMALEDWPRHVELRHRPYHLVPLAKPVWFWWQLRSRWPKNCMHCGVRLLPDGTCPNLMAMPEDLRYQMTDDWGLLDPGIQWVPEPF